MTCKHAIYTIWYHCSYIWMQITVGNPELRTVRVYERVAKEIFAELQEYYASGERATPLEEVMQELNL